MDLTNRLYPYPVLSPTLDSVVDSFFDIDVGTKLSKDKIDLAFDMKLKNKVLKELIYNGDVGIFVHVECHKTTFRKIYEIPISLCTEVSEEELIGRTETVISPSDVSGEVDVCPFLIAKTEFLYDNDKFNEDYGGITFPIDMGAVLAEGTQKTISVNIERQTLLPRNSIFVTVPILDSKKKTVSVNSDDDRIKILMPEKMFQQYKSLRMSNDNDNMLWSLIIIPAFVSVLEQLRCLREAKSDELNLKKDMLWYKSMDNCIFKKYNFHIDSEEFCKMDMVEVAEEVLGNPMEPVLNELTQGRDSDEGDVGGEE